jgi:elongation factor G
VEEEEQSEEQKWPVRILPELSEADTTRLKRQRNVGM